LERPLYDAECDLLATDEYLAVIYLLF